ncbi:tetratricopeptide repeat-containing glycosyltransferase family 2 protein [Virgibacillus sediminis]|uniref:Glycosyltransferase n=1 Tax=Virgibacillus sediminis TaxID=202260 RepID=A0ABV7A3J6_9BACI
MITISLCMIVKDEEDTLPNCLDSIKDCVDEIVVVDTGSSDRTKEIAHQYTNHVHDFEWIDDFSAARNFSFKHATKDYILWLDADDILREEDRKKLINLKNKLDPSVNAVSMIYHYAFDEYGNVTLSFRRNRLVRRKAGFKWHDPVHEYIAVDGPIVHSDIVVTHKRIHHASGRNLAIYEKRLERGETFSARDLFYYANELRDHRQYEKAVDYYQKFLDREDGWVEDKISACDKLADCYYHLGETDRERETVFQSFLYDSPRAEFCCRLGYQFLNNQEYKKAAFWYELAASMEKPEKNMGFLLNDCWTWLPHLQLCICYYHLGEHKRAYEHNEVARKYRPNDRTILSNKEFFETNFPDDCR